KDIEGASRGRLGAKDIGTSGGTCSPEVHKLLRRRGGGRSRRLLAEDRSGLLLHRKRGCALHILVLRFRGSWLLGCLVQQATKCAPKHGLPCTLFRLLIVLGCGRISLECGS